MARRTAGSRVRAPIRVLLVDDHRLVTDAVERLLGREEDIVVAGTIGSLAEMRHVREAPDVILMDYQLPDGTGAELTRIAKLRWPRARVLMLTATRDEETILETVRAGADGYLTKDRIVREVAEAIRALSAGEVLLSTTTMSAMAMRLAAPPDERPRTAPLTARELEVLRHLARGRTGRAIATELGVSADTVRTHVQAIRRKLDAHTQLEAVATALEQGLIEPPSR